MKFYILKVFIMTFVSLVLVNLFADSFSSFIKDDEYLISQHKKSVLNGKYRLKFAPEVLVVGDCLALNNFPNTLFHKKSYNLALPGMTPFEVYFHSKKFIKLYPSVKKVIYLVSGAHFVEQGQIYSMTLLNGLLDFREIQQLANDFERYNYQYQALDYEAGMFYNLLSSKIRLYLDFLSVPIGRTLNNLRFFKRCFNDNCFFKKKRDFVRATITGQGHYFYEDQNGLEGAYKKLKEWSVFKPDRLVTKYFIKNITFFKENNIEVSIVHSPVSKISFESVSKEFYESYKSYFKKEYQKFPMFKLINEIKVYPNSDFVTDIYLRPSAARKFALSLKRKLEDYE